MVGELVVRWQGDLFVGFLLPLVVAVLWPQLPGVLVSSLDVVDADVTQDLLQVNLEGERMNGISRPNVYDCD